MLSEDILQEVGGWDKLTGEHLAALLEEGILFEHLTGVVELLLSEAAQQGNFALLTAALNGAEKWTAVPVFVRVLMTLEGMGHENFQPLVGHLAQNAEADKACGVLLQASYEFGTKQRNRPFLFCSDMAREVAQRSVNQGRDKLANYLAGALMNKGLALDSLGRLTEEIGCYEEAIGITLRLVEEEERIELANYLARALVNKGVALEQSERWQDALEHYRAGIGWWERMVKAGMTHVTPDLIKGLRIRFDLFFRLARRRSGQQRGFRWFGLRKHPSLNPEWSQKAAEDVVRALTYAAPFLQTDSPPEPLMREFETFLGLLRAPKRRERAALYSALGEQAEVVRRLIEAE